MTDNTLLELTKWTPDDVEMVQDDVPAEYVLEGNPEWWTGIAWASSDRRTVAGCFRGTPGRFLYEPPADETTFVRAGHVVITAQDGTREEFRAGDVMSIKAGARLEFDVRETLEDTWVWSSPDPIEY